MMIACKCARQVHYTYVHALELNGETRIEYRLGVVVVVIVVLI
jgi:hypothetical protein